MGDEVNLEKIAFPIPDNTGVQLIREMNSKIYPNELASQSNRNNDKTKYISKDDFKWEQFPGSHPITLLRKHIRLLLENDYYVCEKSDGVRLLLLVRKRKDEKIAFFIDRKNKVYKLYFELPDLEYSLFDGELYVDTVNGKSFIVFAIFDTLIYNDENVMKRNLQQRLELAAKFVCILKKPAFMYIEVKKMIKSYGFCEVYHKIPKLNHKNDGMIFTPVNAPYEPGRCNTLFKWKPSHLNTVDFVMVKKKGYDNVYELRCFGSGREMCVFDHYIDEDVEEDNVYDNLVGEFSYNNEKVTLDLCDMCQVYGGWELHRVRTDKTTPNSYKVVVNVMLSINEGITYDELQNYYKRMMVNYKSRNEASQPTKKHR